MAAGSTENWARYYEMADRRRRDVGGDPLVRYEMALISREKRWLVATFGSLAMLIGTYWFVLVR